MKHPNNKYHQHYCMKIDVKDKAAYSLKINIRREIFTSILQLDAKSHYYAPGTLCNRFSAITKRLGLQFYSPIYFLA